MNDVPLGLVFAVLGGGVMLLGLVVGLFWWVGRPAAKPAVKRGEEPLPLFGHAHAAIWGREDADVQDGDAVAEVLSARAERARAADAVPAWRARESDGVGAATRNTATSTGTAANATAPSAAAGASPTAAEATATATKRRAPFGPASYAPPPPVGSTTAAPAAPAAVPPTAPPHAPSARPAVPSAAPSPVPVASRHASAATPAIMAATTVGPPSPRLDGRTVRFSVPTDATLQFLPGRLEIIRGEDAGREIRFVRTAGVEGAEITFGRHEGAPFRHVQLHDATVSRQHAVLRLTQGRWMLTNRSTTNPVVHNGRTMGDGESQALGTGDTVEMGQVVFRFRD